MLITVKPCKKEPKYLVRKNSFLVNDMRLEREYLNWIDWNKMRPLCPKDWLSYAAIALDNWCLSLTMDVHGNAEGFAWSASG